MLGEGTEGQGGRRIWLGQTRRLSGLTIGGAMSALGRTPTLAVWMLSAATLACRTPATETPAAGPTAGTSATALPAGGRGLLRGQGRSGEIAPRARSCGHGAAATSARRTVSSRSRAAFLSRKSAMTRSSSSL